MIHLLTITSIFNQGYLKSENQTELIRLKKTIVKALRSILVYFNDVLERNTTHRTSITLASAFNASKVVAARDECCIRLGFIADFANIMVTVTDLHLDISLIRLR